MNELVIFLSLFYPINDKATQINEAATNQAAYYITSPIDVVDEPPCAEAYDQIKFAIITLGIEWEIIDIKESDCIMRRLVDWTEELDTIKRRYQNLKDAPKLIECNKLPEKTILRDMISFNRSYRHEMQKRADADMIEGELYRTIVRETDLLFNIYDKMEDARSEYFYVSVRRQALKDLRKLVGPENYYLNEWPCHVPIWRFIQD